MKRLKFDFVGLVPRVLFIAGAILLGTLVVALAGESLFHRKVPVPSDGELDLTQWDFSTGGPVSLGGSWSFESGKLLSGGDFGRTGKVVSRRVPDTRFSPREGGFFSGTGSGTYRLTVLLPPASQDLGIRFSTVWTAFELEANGSIITRVGNPGLPPRSSSPGYGAGIARLDVTGDRLEIIVRVSNNEYRWGGIVRPFVLGKTAALIDQKRWDDMMAFLMVGALCGIGANSLFLFAFRRRDRIYLYFTAFAFAVALRALTSGDGLVANLFPMLSFDSFVRIGFTSQYLLLPAAALFFHRLFAEDFTRSMLLWYLTISFAFCLLVPFASVAVLSWSLLPYSLVAFSQAAYGYVAVCLRPAINQRLGSGIVLTAGTILMASILLNIRNEVFLSRAESGFPLDLAAFVIVQSLVMARRFTWAFEQTEALTNELKSANRLLMEEARAAEDARDSLEVALSEKDVLLKEVHHRVKNSLQIVLSVISLQVRREKDPKALAAYSSVRDRIRAISSMHDRLFGLDSEKRIDLGDYADELLRNLRESYGIGSPSFSFESDSIHVPMDLCLEIGLMLTELVINSYRHADAKGRPIQVTLRREASEILLTVADNGPGFPDGFLPETVTTVGFRIIVSMVRQRGGNLVVSNNPGAVVQVRIPLPPLARTAVHTA
jgi:two-component sensor histidine kinase